MKKIYLKPEYNVDNVMNTISSLKPKLKEVSVVYHISYIDYTGKEPENRAFTLDKNNRRIVFSLYADQAKSLLKDMLEVK